MRERFILFVGTILWLSLFWPQVVEASVYGGCSFGSRSYQNCPSPSPSPSPSTTPTESVSPSPTVSPAVSSTAETPGKAKQSGQGGSQSDTLASSGEETSSPSVSPSPTVDNQREQETGSNEATPEQKRQQQIMLAVTTIFLAGAGVGGYMVWYGRWRKGVR